MTSISSRLKAIFASALLASILSAWAVNELYNSARSYSFASMHAELSHKIKTQIELFENHDEINNTTHGIEESLDALIKLPLACINHSGPGNKLILWISGLGDTIIICEKDVQDINSLKSSIEQYNDKQISKPQLLRELKTGYISQANNVRMFKSNIDEKVEFILSFLVPAISIVVVFCLALIVIYTTKISKALKKTKKIVNCPRSQLSDQEIESISTTELQAIVKAVLKTVRDQGVQELMNQELEHQANKNKQQIQKLNTLLFEIHQQADDIDKHALSELYHNLEEFKREATKSNNLVLADIVERAQSHLQAISEHIKGNAKLDIAAFIIR